jgi:hypothetical protein
LSWSGLLRVEWTMRVLMLMILTVMILSLILMFLVLLSRHYHMPRRWWTSAHQSRGTFVHFVSHLLQTYSLTPTIMSEFGVGGIRGRDGTDS